MPHEIALATACNHCQRKFYGPKGPVIVGERPQARVAKFIESLGKHIVDAHPDIAQQMTARIWEFQGFALMRNYTTEDAQVRQQENYFRWKLHQMTLRCRAQKLEERADMVATESMSCLEPTTDPEQIEQRAAMHTIIRRSTHAALEELRGLLEEPDLYVAQPAELTPENTAS